MIDIATPIGVWACFWLLWLIYGELTLIVKIMDRTTGYSARESLTDGWRAGIPRTKAEHNCPICDQIKGGK
jgi:hypothetical protein